MTRQRAVLVLADGTHFEGDHFGADGLCTGEVVFNTSMFGYQEVLTDPSYVGQIVTMAAVHMGNVGANGFDDESAHPHAVGMIVKTDSPASNWRSETSLSAFLKKHNVVGLSGIDTRQLVRHLRTHGAQPGVISNEGNSLEALLEKAKRAPSMAGLDLASRISTTQQYEWNEGTPNVLGTRSTPGRLPKHRVVAIDYGLKKAMLRYLVDFGCQVTVVPSSTSAAEILALKPAGVFLTNGPGDPSAVVGAEKTVATLLGKVPVFGICLGHQILALALGAKTFKMKFGHRGANQPVLELSSGRVEITAQNHGFAVDAESVKNLARVTHLNLNDRTVEGLSVPDAKAFSVQYHPESSPGPHDSVALFGQFVALMEQQR
jgi:carbamoyl-phosphate synthase small subunit